MKIRKLAINAMLSAMCAVLGYVALDMGSLKLSFESFPILLGALLFGPVDGMLIGGVGTLIYQLLRYGVTVATPLWMLPYALCGLALGAYSRHKGFAPGKRQILMAVVLAELMITALNTGVLCVDGLIYGYYSPLFIYGALGPRLAICLGKALAFGLVLPRVKEAVGRLTHPPEAGRGGSSPTA